MAMVLYNYGSRSKQFLSVMEIWNRDRRIPRSALIDPQSSPWERLYTSKNDQALITLLGFDHQAFHELEKLFEPYFYNYTPWNADGETKIKKIDPRKVTGGRPRKVDARSCLALSLAYYRFRGPFYILQGWFGLTGTPLSAWTEFSRLIIIQMLENDKSKIQWPSLEKIEVYKKIIERRHPVLQNVFCVADGLKIQLQQGGDPRVQSRFYNGWMHSHYVTNLFVFGPDGLILASVINAPGSVHDSMLADWGNIYDSLYEIHEETGGRCVMDSAFAAVNHPAIIKSSQNEAYARNALELLTCREATSLRQAAEWGMRAIQSSFPRLKDKIRYEENGSRQLILLCMVMLYNFRCDRVGLNQIKTVYVPEWNKTINDNFENV